MRTAGSPSLSVASEMRVSQPNLSSINSKALLSKKTVPSILSLGAPPHLQTLSYILTYPHQFVTIMKCFGIIMHIISPEQADIHAEIPLWMQKHRLRKRNPPPTVHIYYKIWLPIILVPPDFPSWAPCFADAPSGNPPTLLFRPDPPAYAA